VGAERFGEMDTFVKVVELGGMTAAARAKRMSPSAISKQLTRLEDRLQTRLLNRSTRALQLTSEGRTFYENSARLLADLQEIESATRNSRVPSGRIRINTSLPFLVTVLAPLMADFMALYPNVFVDITCTDAIVDILNDRADVAIRTGPLKDSRMVARKLGETRRVVVAAPTYLSRAGTPHHPSDLERHNLISFSYSRAIDGWPFREGEKDVMVQPNGRTQANDGEALRNLVLHGVGLARLPLFANRQAIMEGRLQVVLEPFNPGDTEAFYAVHLGSGHMPARTRAFLDFLVERAVVT
jgi:DNA-binding transcriptional LysR family regulator